MGELIRRPEAAVASSRGCRRYRHGCHHDVVGAVDELLPLVRWRIDEIAAGRRLTDDVERSMRAAGVNRMLLPAQLGGLETPISTAMDVVERLSIVDGSTGWCAIIGAGSNIFAGYLPEEGAAEVFADPDRSSATMFAPLGTLQETADGSLRLSGRWPFVSGCRHAEWIGLGAKLRRHGGDVDAVPRLAFVRAADLAIEDTWDVVGLRGTGSHHVAATELTVEPKHCCEFIGEPWPDAPLWRMPVFSVILPMLAAVPLGIARGALDEVARQVRDGRSAVRRGDLATDPLAMHDLAAAELRLAGARAILYDLVRTAHDHATRNEALDPPFLARIYLANLHATETAVDVTAVAHRLGGGAATYADSRLLLALNDVQAVQQHYQFAREHRVALGRVLTGVTDDYPPYIT
jgi:alkylation response protein AidB-like acyl-CoA dehydrogenase